jgi:DNA-binding response OmpR family regulator
MEQQRPQATILVVDDEKSLCRMIGDFLEDQGYHVVLAFDGSDAIDRFFLHQPIDLVILDVMMPQIDGLEVCQTIREHAPTPILFLTAKDQPEDEIQGLAIGGDDYLGKPFRYDILMAHIKAILRREQRSSKEPITLGPLHIDDDRHEIRCAGKFLPLTPKEYAMLRFLAECAPKALSRESIMEHLWGYDYEADERVVDTYVKNIRAHLGPYKHIIITIRSFGYRLDWE